MASTSNNNYKYTSKLAGTSVLIVGGTSGLGYGVAEALVEHGVGNLYISSSRQTKIDATVDKLKKQYPDAVNGDTDSNAKTNIIGLRCDLADGANLEDNVRELFARIAEIHKGQQTDNDNDSNDTKVLDHIVFTAGDALATTPLSQVTVQSAQQAGMVRFFAPLMVAKHGHALLKPGPASSITLTTGAAAEKPAPGWSVIAAFAAGLFGMIRGLAVDLRPVRVNVVSPGAVDTELWDSMGDKKQEIIKEYEKKQATGKVGAVEDVVEGYLFLMKDKNVTGTVVRSDGGVFLM